MHVGGCHLPSRTQKCCAEVGTESPCSKYYLGVLEDGFLNGGGEDGTQQIQVLEAPRRQDLLQRHHVVPALPCTRPINLLQSADRRGELTTSVSSSCTMQALPVSLTSAKHQIAIM